MSIYTTTSNQISFEMHSALEQFNEHRNTLKMTTGSADLDSLIDGIQEGVFYLFYGSNHAVLDALVYRFLINCVLPTKQKHGFESMGVCFNNADYYSNNSSKLAFSPEKIGVASKCAGIDPKIVFKNLYVHSAYNEQHQLLVAEQVADLIESNRDIKLLVVNNITKFFKEYKNKVALICSGDANLTGRGLIPRPIGGIYLKHTASVIVHIRELSKTSATPSFKATLIKHQYTQTPKSAILYIRKTGGIV